MSVTYRILYRLGFTPWEHSEPPEPLAALIEGPQARPVTAGVAAPPAGSQGDTPRRRQTVTNPSRPG